MPVFNWDGNGTPVMKTGFGVYWIVTVPLTVFVLLVWVLAMFLPWRKWVDGFGGRGKGSVDDVELRES